MIIKFNFVGKNTYKKSQNLVVFYSKGWSVDNIDYDQQGTQKNLIAKYIKEAEKFTKKEIQTINLQFDKKILLIKLDKDKKINSAELLGAKLFNFLKDNEINDLYFSEKNIKNLTNVNNTFLADFFHGLEIKSYEFLKYKSAKKEKILTIFIPNNFKSQIIGNKKYKSLIEGIKLTKDLVSEPGNILHPDEYVNRLKKLKSVGLKITIFDKKKLKKLGMNALLGVGQGSIRGSYLATIEWNGSSKKQKPLAFVGKGVCFDTGGISLKPAKFMEDMTYDMAGSAVVVGLMKTLALRKAKVNVVGVVGLVENMPDGNAQRPGDVVKSYSGQTIEIFNTDAEGRLVLADILTYTEKRFKPKFMINLATLTGAIIVSLGNEFAGLFSNNDQLAERINKVSYKDNEKAWRLPLDKNFDKLMDSKIADMQNINYSGGAGSITAAQFLQRFIMNKTPWAHLDIAGMAWTKKTTKTIPYGATGYGVKLLNRLVEEYYE